MSRHWTLVAPAMAAVAPLGTTWQLAAPSDKPAALPPGAASQAPTLLLVDDEPLILRALSRMLRREGLHILSAASAVEALVLLAKHPVQVVLSDQIMPGMRGTELLGQVRQRYPDVMRLMLSGYTERGTAEDATEHGLIHHFVCKPWDDIQLRDLLQQVFRDQRAHCHVACAA